MNEMYMVYCKLKPKLSHCIHTFMLCDREKRRRRKMFVCTKRWRQQHMLSIYSLFYIKGNDRESKLPFFFSFLPLWQYHNEKYCIIYALSLYARQFWIISGQISLTNLHKIYKQNKSNNNKLKNEKTKKKFELLASYNANEFSVVDATVVVWGMNVSLFNSTLIRLNIRFVWCAFHFVSVRHHYMYIYTCTDVILFN